MLARSFTQFIFESQFGQDRLDFCLDMFSEYRKEGKTMQDLPEDVQKCIRGGGQSDFGPTVNQLYLKYLENDKSFDGIEDIEFEQGDESSMNNNIMLLGKVLKAYGNSIQYSLVSEGENNYQLVVAGRKITINRIFDELIESFGEDKLIYLTQEDHYSDIIIYLNENEVELLGRLLD